MDAAVKPPGMGLRDSPERISEPKQLKLCSMGQSRINEIPGTRLSFQPVQQQRKKSMPLPHESGDRIWYYQVDMTKHTVRLFIFLTIY